MSQEKTVPTTGSGTQPATTAQGTITLYNALSIAQTIPAGTLLVGADGVQVTTDSTVTIPAGNAPTEGEINVTAHTLQPGPAGNIPALDIDAPCCRAEVIAKNTDAFTGGQNARSYQAVSTQDIQAVATGLVTELQHQETATDQTELGTEESLTMPLSCTSQTSTDHAAGDEATQVTVKVSETCQGTAYHTAQLQNLIEQATTRQIQGSQAGSYELDPATESTQVIASDGQASSLKVKANGVLVYHWTNAQLQALAVQMAGKSKSYATTLLRQQPGIVNVSMQINGRDNGSLPADLDAFSLFLPPMESEGTNFFGAL